MKKNLLDKEANELIVQRVQKLRADTRPHWGTMSATEMLLHCNKAHELMLTTPTAPSGKGTTVTQYLTRWVVLYLLPKLPKNARAPGQIRTRGTINDAAFEEQKQAFIALMRRFPQHTEPIQHDHPYFGALRTQQWGLSGWKHVDHHLRQFGV